jgi:hypothetical protein
MATTPLLERPEERASSTRALASSKASLETRVLWSLLAMLWLGGVLVFWFFEALPFQDLPAHAGLIALRSRYAQSLIDQQNFVLAAHVGPYTLFRVIGEVTAAFLGPLGAVRVLATLPALTLPAAMLFARKEFHGQWEPIVGFAGVILSFGFMTVLGFASYMLGLSLLLFTLPCWFRVLLNSSNIKKDAVVLAGMVLLLFVAHGHAFLLFLGTAAVSCVLSQAAGRKQAVFSLLPALTLAALVAGFERTSGIPAGSALVSPHIATTFQPLPDKLSLLITPTLMTRTGVDFLVGIVLWIFVLFVVIRASKERATLSEASKILLIVTALFFLTFLALPHTIKWFGFVDGRIVPLFLIFPLIAAASLPGALLVRRVSPLMTALVVGGVWIASARFQSEAAGYKEVLGQIPANARILNLPVDPDSAVFTGHPFVHYDKLVLLDRPAIPSDVWFHQGTALYPTPANPSLSLPESYVESNLGTIAWNDYSLDAWDYVLIRSRDPKLLGRVPDSLHPVDHRGGWWLLQRSR